MKIKYLLPLFALLISLGLASVAMATDLAQQPSPESEGIDVNAPDVEEAKPEAVSDKYTFAQSLGTYTPITGGTVHGTSSNDDTNFNAINLGFTFYFNGHAYTQVSIQSNGFVAMGAAVTSSYTPLSTGTSNNVVAALGRDIQGNGTTSELMSLMEGTAPNRIFTIQWSHYKRYGTTYVGDDFNFQIKLYETSDKVEFVYGVFTAIYYATPPSMQVGLRGDSNADFNNRTTATDWTASTAGSSNTDAMTLTDLIYPPSGLTFEWTVQPYVDIFPDSSASACRGTTVDYPLTAINYTPLTDTLNIVGSGFVWPTTINPASLILPPKGSGSVAASVHIPWAAAVGDQDVATLTATGQTSGLSGSATLTTQAAIFSGYTDYANVPVGREVRAPSVVYHDGRLYKIGGYGYIGTTGAARAWLDIYDIATDTWSPGADMPGARYWINCEAIGDGIYCAGGYLTSGQTTLYRYDIPSDTWTTLTAMSAYRYDYASVTLNGKYYLVGGYGAGYTATLWEYDPATNAWNYGLASMITPRRYASAGVIGGKIYVAGGYSPTYLSSVEIYDPVTNTWSAGADMPTPWVTAADGVFMDRYLLMAGGDDNSTATSSNIAWIYDAVTNTWGRLPDMDHQLYSAEGDGDGTNFWIVSGRLYDGAYSNSPYTTAFDQCAATCTPVSGLDFTVDPTSPLQGLPATFSAIASGSPEISYEWDFGDGNTGSGAVIDHVYAAAGIYTVELTASNCDGANTATISHDVTVLLPPTIEVNPLEMYALQLPDTITTQQLEICNLGDLPLVWELSEAEATPPVGQPAAPSAPAPQPEIMRLPDGSVDCAAYENYTLYEPVEVAQACGGALDTTPTSFASPLAPTDTGFAMEMYSSDTLRSFTLNNFPGQTTIGASPTYYGMDFDESAEILYALDDLSDQLGTVDLTTGAFTPLVACPPGGGAANWTGLSIDPVSGIFYGSTATDLYTIDPATGVSTWVGTFGTTLMIDIAVNIDGDMYGHDIGTDSIYSIDPASGLATLIGSTGLLANFAQGMDFDNDDGTLYIFAYTGSGTNTFGTVDLTTGLVTPLAVNSPLGEFEGAVMVPGLIFDLPWVSETPITGTIPADSCINVDVTFDSTGLAIGTYRGDFEITSNDPFAPMTIVRVQLDVAAGVEFMYHDLEDVVLPGESVYVTGNFSSWDPEALEMTPNGDFSEFTTSIILPPGDYEYKYIVYTDTVPSGPPHWDWLQSYPDGHDRTFTVIDTSLVLHNYRDIVPGYWILQWPPETTTYVGVPTENIYGQYWAYGFTNEGVEPRGLLAELGYGTEADPAIWATWDDMVWSSQQGDNAEYFDTITPMASGVYSYAVRYNANWGIGNPNDTGWYYGDLVFDATPVYNPADAGVLTVLDQFADLAITKIDTPDPVGAGETLVYTITVENLGDFDTTGVVVTDTLPAGVTFIDASTGCVEASGVVTCDVGEMMNGASVALFIEVLAPDDPGTITNKASVTSDLDDPDDTNNTVFEDTDVFQTTFFTYLPFSWK